MVLMQQKDPLELFVKSREFLSGSGFLSRDMTRSAHWKPVADRNRSLGCLMIMITLLK